MNMLKAKLNKKLGKNGGFTLVEMLIVVAIIAILIAVSIPVVSTALEKARDATDDANFRSAAALGTIEFLSGADNAAGTYYYHTTDSAQGELVEENAPSSGAYEAQCTAAKGTTGHGKTGSFTGAHIEVVIAADGAVTTSWK